MTYEKTPIKEPKLKDVTLQVAQGLPSTTLVWLLVKRHKTGLFATWAIVITIMYLFPFAPSLLVSMF